MWGSCPVCACRGQAGPVRSGAGVPQGPNGPHGPVDPLRQGTHRRWAKGCRRPMGRRANGCVGRRAVGHGVPSAMAVAMRIACPLREAVLGTEGTGAQDGRTRNPTCAHTGSAYEVMRDLVLYAWLYACSTMVLTAYPCGRCAVAVRLPFARVPAVLAFSVRMQLSSQRWEQGGHGDDGRPAALIQVYPVYSCTPPAARSIFS
jgi:hypothetical protein